MIGRRAFVATTTVGLVILGARAGAQDARPFARIKVDLIVAGSTPAALAAKAATSTIPIVMMMGGDPVARGLAASMPHPGGNVTGVTASSRS